MDNTLSWSYGYDSLDRLTSASSVPDSETSSSTPNSTRLGWSGTVFGQAISGTYGVDSGSNRITSVSLTGANSESTAIQYDGAGHVVSEWSATATYNAAGRPIALTGAAAGQYALAQRISKVTPFGTLLFAYDESGHLLGEYDGTGAWVEEAVWLGDVPVATLQPDAKGNVAIYYFTPITRTPRERSPVPPTISSCGAGISIRLPISNRTGIRKAWESSLITCVIRGSISMLRVVSLQLLSLLRYAQW